MLKELLNYLEENYQIKFDNNNEYKTKNYNLKLVKQQDKENSYQIQFIDKLDFSGLGFTKVCYGIQEFFASSPMIRYSFKDIYAYKDLNLVVEKVR